MRPLQHPRRHLGRAAELAGQRPFGARAVAQHAAEHLCARRRAGDLLDLGLAIDRKEAHAELVGARDVALLLDRVAEADAVGRRAGRERLLDLRHARRSRSRSRAGRAGRASPAPDWPSRRRTRACPATPWRSCDSSRGRRRDRRRGAGRLRGLRARNSLMRSVIAASPARSGRRACAKEREMAMRRPPARDGDAQAFALTRQSRPSTETLGRRAVAPTVEGQMLRRSFKARSRLRGSKPSFGKEETLPHARQDRQASSVRRPLEGRQRPKKPGPSLLQVASPVGRGTPVRLRLPIFTRAVDWPLVQIPTDRHTTTGTCELGKA